MDFHNCPPSSKAIHPWQKTRGCLPTCHQSQGRYFLLGNAHDILLLRSPFFSVQKKHFLPVKPIFFAVKTPYLTRGPGDRSWPCQAVSRSGRGMNIAVVNPDGSLSSFQAMGMPFTEGPCLNLFLPANILIKQDKTNIYSCFITEIMIKPSLVFFY